MKTVFTIATYSHYWQAKLLMQSVRNYEPDARLVIALVEYEQDLDLEQKIDHVWAEDLLPNIEMLSSRYSAAELCFITKPAAFEYLLNEGKSEEVYYFDSDIRLYHNLEPCSDTLKESNILLTPHHLFPFEDLNEPKEFDNLRTGTFNMGFCAMRPTLEAERLCKWWKINAQNFGEEQFDLGLSADQQWMNLAPTLFDSVKVLKHPGANVAFWNLHERELRKRQETYQVNGQPLLFFHFSNFQLEPNLRLVQERLYHREDLLKNEVISEVTESYVKEILQAKNEQSGKLEKPLAQSIEKRVKNNLKSFGWVKITLLRIIHSLPTALKVWIYKFGLFLVRNIKMK